ncbi:MAG: PQQ-dependent sugar dehydrogenase [Longimicrobiales bacterium]
MHNNRVRHTKRSALVCVLFAFGSGAPPLYSQTPDLTADWELMRGFRLDTDAGGFRYPSALAFVPEPGPGPKDPLYFVLELWGDLKVVTNDRSVITFAERFAPFTPPVAQPMNQGENGAAGLCLAPRQGFVFVTYVYQDSAGVLRNGITRFESTPRTFSTRAGNRTVFNHVLSADTSIESHQIGTCRVDGDHLFVSLADGQRPERAQSVSSTLGKVLRFRLDGQPAKDNPFRSDTSSIAASYVWALGFRNPFGLAVARNRLFATENGLAIDRFLEIEKGRRYPWDGTDLSLGTNAAVVFYPAVSPVSLEYLAPDANVFPREHRDRFYVALAGGAGVSGPSTVGAKSIVRIDYDFEASRLRAPPEPFARFIGTGIGTIVGVAFGPDGLYLAPLFPGPDSTSTVLKISYDPARPHEFVIGEPRTAGAVMAQKNCMGCHRIGRDGGTAGPPITPAVLIPALRARLNSSAYVDSLAALDGAASPGDPRVLARAEVVSAQDEGRVRTWLTNRLLDPRFDSPAAQMPDLELTRAQATMLADYFVSAAPSTSAVDRVLDPIRSRIPTARYRYVIIAFVLGLLIPIVYRSFRRGVRRG